MPPARCPFLFLLLSLLTINPVRGQTVALNLEECVAYALENEPGLRALRQQQTLTELDNDIAMSDWKPQIGITGNLRNNIKQQVSIFPDLMNPGSGETQEVEIGTPWVSLLGASVNQLIYSPEITLEDRLNAPRLKAAALAIEEGEISLKAAVHNAFYRALRARERSVILATDLERLTRSLRDARLLYEEGVNDKVDYKRATIARNQTRADLGAARIDFASRLAELKEVMGFPKNEALDLKYDYEEFRRKILQDSLPIQNQRERVEVRTLTNALEQQQLNTQYFQRAWWPRVSATGTYNYNWQDADFGALYNRSFPNAFVSLNLSVPLFQGGRRLRQLERARVGEEQIRLELRALLRTIEREFTLAENEYRAARLNYAVARENSDLAQEVYDVVLLQYQEGIKPFLEVVIAESDLRVTRLNSLDQLIAMLLARVEVRRVAGTL